MLRCSTGIIFGDLLWLSNENFRSVVCFLWFLELIIVLVLKTNKHGPIIFFKVDIKIKISKPSNFYKKPGQGIVVMCLVKQEMFQPKSLAEGKMTLLYTKIRPSEPGDSAFET